MQRKMYSANIHRIGLLLSFIFFVACSTAQAQTSAFTYQGNFTDSTAVQQPTNGIYDFQFTLYDAQTGGTQQPQPGPTTVTLTSVPVTNGVFTVQLDFGATAFPGADRYLEIAVKRPEETTYTPLSPRQQITATPYAIRAMSASASDALSASCTGCITNDQISTVDGAKVMGSVANATNATNAANAANLGGVAATNYLLKNGDGSGLKNLPTGLLPWTVTGDKSVRAQSNRGYVLTNNVAQVVVTLPSSPSVGDIVRVTGVGGWRISQNANQVIGGADLGFTQWTPRESNRAWQSVASSSDGTKLVAVVDGGQIYTATDGASSTGMAGYLTGGHNAAVELLYVGGGKFRHNYLAGQDQQLLATRAPPDRQKAQAQQSIHSNCARAWDSVRQCN